MKRILISGGAGYLGTFMTQEFLKKYEVIVYDKFYFPWIKKNFNKIKNNSNLKFIKKKIADVEVSDFDKVDIVCDLNGISNDPSSELDSKYTWKINFKDRYNFAKIVKKAKVKRYIFNSTCSVYGHSKKKVFESNIKKPISTYAKANLAAENAIYKLKNKSFKINILRNSTLYGFSNVLRLDLVINIFVYNIINKKKLSIGGDGLQFRPFMSLNEVTKTYISLIENKKFPSFICNLVSFNSNVKNIAKNICKILKVSEDFITYKGKYSDKRNYIVGSRNFYKYFGKKFKFSKFKNEILNLKKEIIKSKIKLNNSTIRMKFYKNLFHKI